MYVSRLELALHKKFLNHRNASIYVLTIFLNISKIYWVNLTLSVNIRVQLDFHPRAKLNIFHENLLSKSFAGISYGETQIMPVHWLLHRHIITFHRFLDRRLLFCGIIACLKFFLFFFVLPFFNCNTSMEVKGITHTLLWYNIIWYNII